MGKYQNTEEVLLEAHDQPSIKEIIVNLVKPLVLDTLFHYLHLPIRWTGLSEHSNLDNIVERYDILNLEENEMELLLRYFYIDGFTRDVILEYGKASL